MYVCICMYVCMYVYVCARNIYVQVHILYTLFPGLDTGDYSPKNAHALPVWRPTQHGNTAAKQVRMGLYHIHGRQSNCLHVTIIHRHMATYINIKVHAFMHIHTM